ncbi:unnamed protein product [Clonostachys byssicola]|uniref:Cellulose-binding protein n=1 Tax=Clonostachys byssicola TaxID=160290 RepID=A0A9N9Y3Z5_9HYPO|nr:unnamed protein product [Clonostachys byssicola]
MKLLPYLRSVALGLVLVAQTASASSSDKCELAPSAKPRVFLLSDIANEPDDAQSFVRLLVYANEFRLRGIIATTSVWLNDSTRPDQMHDIVDAYGDVIHNLRKHADGWPEATELKRLIASGLPVYGMEGVGEGKDSDGSRMLVRAVDASEEPLWVLIWGGASVLAQALWHVNATRSQAETDIFVSKVRAYAISDQDNTGTWIRRNWPELLYIASVHHFNRYAVAAWGGISGDDYYHFPSAANKDVISKSWIAENIQSQGSLGAKYPEADFIIEGDTPSLLYVIPNGLSDPEHPEWGSWGGRYGPVAYGEGHFADSVDTIIRDGHTLMGSHVTVWRWREAFQKDFAARMRWSVESDFSAATHAPVAAINGDNSRNIIKIVARGGDRIELDASSSCDKSGRDLNYSWWQYLEPSSNNNNPKRDVALLELESSDAAKINVTIPPIEVIRRQGRNAHPEADKHLHLILEVSNGQLVSYRRVIFTILGPGSEARSHDEL